MFQHYQVVQFLSKLHPEFDFYWQFELDARYTGQHYHFLEQIDAFAKGQPRKYLWERNARFYIPSIHGSWDNFSTLAQTSNISGIWGPKAPENVVPSGPEPPTGSPAQDDYNWGVGEDADLITFLPIFDPVDSGWVMSHSLYNFPPSVPRRTSVNTMSRLSKRLLDIMNYEQAVYGRGFASEMSAASFALHHGLKAVYVPHPIFQDRSWPT